MTAKAAPPGVERKNGARTGRFVVEAIVIVSSILLAFGIDAWWDDRKERVEEAEILAGLEREFTGYRDALERGLAQHAEMLDAMSAVLVSIDEGDWVSSEWRMDDAIGRLLSPPTSNLGNGVRDALVQGGRLELLSDPVLRERLAQWPGYYEELLDDQVFSRDLVFDEVIPYLMRQGIDLSAMLIAGTMVGPDRESAWPVAVRRVGDDPVARRRLLADPEFRALVSVRFSYWHHAGGEYRAALEAAEEILELLDRPR
ncbi:MAG: hypothetical protein R3344_03005 [Acidobacteriota bacterium]|nr:hypothetical protein [Acidobacteriota bacterium]